MQWIKLTTPMKLSCAVVECYSPGHINLARCIRRLFVVTASMYDISEGNAVTPAARELMKKPPVFLCSDSPEVVNQKRFKGDCDYVQL